MSQALYRKWRPQSWDEIIGQDHATQTLKNSVSAGRIAHAYLFAGARGTGKTTTARVLAKAANCLDENLSNRPCNQCEHCKAVNQGRFLDLIEIDAASNTSVEDVRSLRDKINFAPNQGRYKVYIIDEVHMLSTAAFNALLKTLEEPPAHAIFILATTEVHKIPATVLSRCQRHEFRRIPIQEIVKKLKSLVKSEKIKIDEEALTLVARQSTGSMRDAISLLDQLASTGDKVTLRQAQEVLGTAASQSVLDIVDAIIQKDAKTGLDTIHAALDAGSDPRQFTRQVIEYLRGLMLIRMGNADQVEAVPETLVKMNEHARLFSSGQLLHTIKVMNPAAADTRLAWQPALPLELAFIEAMAEAMPPAAAVKSQALPVNSAHAIDEKPLVSPGRAPASEAPASQPASARSTMAELGEKWRQVLSLVARGSYQTEALLRSGHLLGLENDTLSFSISGPLKEKIEKSEHLDLVLKCMSQVFGREIKVQIVVSSGKQKTPPPGVDSDGLVATALRDLGGEIVDIQ